MVVIKEMGTQTDCKKCPFMATDGTDENELNHPMMCVALWGMKHEVRHCVSGKVLDDCPLVEVVTCKDCKYWNKKEEYCKQLSSTMGWEEDECYTVCTGADFFCEDGERRK